MRKLNEFTKKTKKTLAERVAWRCSFPDCGKITIGPKKDDINGVVNLGEAAHIHAASLNGPRFNPDITSSEIKSIENGIWMCIHHATLIDRDYEEYSASTLRLWKKEAELQAYNNLVFPENVISEDNSTFISIGFSLIIKGCWKKASSKIWSFSIDSYIKGSKKDLEKYVLSFSNISEEEKYIIVESQGDARKINKSIELTYDESSKMLIDVFIDEKYKPTDPTLQGIDFYVDDTGDICLEDGGIKTISGIDTAIQRLSLVTSTIYGEYIYNSKEGSFISEYYRNYKEDLLILSKLIKIEFIRLSLIPTSSDKPSLNFVNRFENIDIPYIELVNDRLAVNLELEWGNHERWKGTVNIFIKQEE